MKTRSNSASHSFEDREKPTTAKWSTDILKGPQRKVSSCRERPLLAGNREKMFDIFKF